MYKCITQHFSQYCTFSLKCNLINETRTTCNKEICVKIDNLKILLMSSKLQKSTAIMYNCHSTHAPTLDM